MSRENLIPSEGKFKVIGWAEDLDCIDPMPDWPVDYGEYDTIDEAKKIANEKYKPFTPTVIYDDKGTKIDRHS